MLIAYDRKVLESARRIASNPKSLQRDLLKHLYDEDVLNWDGTNSGPIMPYLAPEAREEIKLLIRQLPRRNRNKL